MFFDQVQKLCDERNLAPSTLARKLNLSPNAPANWKAGSYPKAETIMKIAEFFDVSTDFLLYGSGHTGNTASHVSGGALLQSSSSNTVSVSAGGSELQGFEAELIRIYRALNMKGKMDLMQYAFGLEGRKDGDSAQ